MNSPTGAETVYSPDGKWIWTGQNWIPAPPTGVTPSAAAPGPHIVSELNSPRPPPSPRRVRQSLSGPNPVFIAGGVLVAGLLAALGIGLVVDAGGVHGSAAAPAAADAEEACRAAFRTTYERDDQAVKARYAREEPTFKFETAMDDVNIWTSIPSASAVEVTGDVEWTLTTHRLGPQSQKTSLNCTATIEDGRIVTSVH